SSSVAGVDTLYVADDGAGLQKYSLVGGNWTANGTVGTGAEAYRGLTATGSGTTGTLYAVRKGGSTATRGGRVVSPVGSSGYNGAFSGTPTLLATAAANPSFRGVAFAPVSSDTTPPQVSSIKRADANPTNAGTVNYTVTFSESVTGVDTTDFVLTTSGVSGASVSSVTGSGSSYTVAVNTGSGDGTPRLALSDADSIADLAGNKLGGTGAGNGNFTSGEVYTIDKTAPVFESVTRADANPTNAAMVHYTVTFSESVTGVDGSDFSLTTSGLSGASVSGVT